MEPLRWGPRRRSYDESCPTATGLFNVTLVSLSDGIFAFFAPPGSSADSALFKSRCAGLCSRLNDADRRGGCSDPASEAASSSKSIFATSKNDSRLSRIDVRYPSSVSVSYTHLTLPTSCCV